MESDRVDTDTDIDSWCRMTPGRRVTGNFLWTIENFLEIEKGINGNLYSKKFAISRPDEKLTWWQLSVFPDNSGCNETMDGGYLAILLHRHWPSLRITT